MPKALERQEVVSLLRRVHRSFHRVLNITQPTLITAQSMQLFLDLYSKDLIAAVRKEREHALLTDWERRYAQFRREWLAAARTNSVSFRGVRHVVITEDATDKSNKSCRRKKGPSYPVP